MEPPADPDVFASPEIAHAYYIALTGYRSERAVDVANRALKISPICPDAYYLLGEQIALHIQTS